MFKFFSTLAITLPVFLSCAHANITIIDSEDPHDESAVVPSGTPILVSDVDTAYKLSSTDRPGVFKLDREVGERVLRSGLHFEEHTTLISSQDQCVELIDDAFYAGDPDIIAIKSEKPIRIFKTKKLSLNNIVAISGGNIKLIGDCLQVKGFFSTPGEIIIKKPKGSPKSLIDRIVIKPMNFRFTSQTECTMGSQSLYLFAKINFGKGQILIKTTCAAYIKIFTNPAHPSSRGVDRGQSSPQSHTSKRRRQ